MSNKWKQFQEDFEDREKPCINIHCEYHDKTGKLEQNCGGEINGDPAIVWCDEYIPEPTCEKCKQLEEKLRVTVEALEKIAEYKIVCEQNKIEYEHQFFMRQIASYNMQQTAKECLKKIGG